MDEHSDLETLVPKMLAYFRRRVTNRHDAEDCAADCIAVIWRRRAKAPQAFPDLEAWAYGVARNVLRTYYRKHNKSDIIIDNVEAERIEQPDSELRIALSEALRTLKQRDRELVLLVGWEGLSIQSAGSALGLKPPAARAAYLRARRQLKDSLGRLGVAPSVMITASDL